MSVAFSARLATLRREQGRTQKQAARELGVSQALLSHYENGIRACSLDFVEKAARYYGVTADYLLGLTQEKTALSSPTAEDPTEADTELNLRTVLRALMFLYAQAQAAGEAEERLFLDYFCVCTGRYADRQKLSDRRPDQSFSFCETLLLSTAFPPLPTQEDERPAALNTVEAHARSVIRARLQSLL